MSQTTIDLERYKNTYHQLKVAIEGLTEEQLNRKPAPDKWSVTEVLSHLVDHSIVFSFRIRKIISETNVQIVTFEQDAWVSHSLANEGSAFDVLDVFAALVQYNHLLFQRLSVKDWEKSGTNVKGETVSVKSSLQSYIDHVQVHLGQIERIKQHWRT